MNKTELVEAIAKKANISKKDAESALKAFTETVGLQLKKGDKTQLVAASKAPKFKAGKALKDLVNKK